MARSRKPHKRRAARRPVVSMVSLGCPKNTVDSERVLGGLIEHGWLVAERPEDADLALVNVPTTLSVVQGLDHGFSSVEYVLPQVTPEFKRILAWLESHK